MALVLAEITALAALALGVAALVDLRRHRPAPDWPQVNAFLRRHDCVAASRDALAVMAGEAGYAARYDASANTLILVDKGETVRVSMGPAEPD